jgi:hypothetical protein
MKERTYIYIGARSEGLGDEYTHSLLHRSQLKLRGGETASQIKRKTQHNTTQTSL